MLAYARVARGVRKLEMFADGDPMAPDLSLGNVLSAARDRDGHAARILDLDAAWFRNAAAHAHYGYLPGDHALELWNGQTLREFFDRHIDLDRASESDRLLLRCVYGDPVSNAAAG